MIHIYMQPFAAAISPLMSLLQSDQRGHVSPYTAVCEVAAHSDLEIACRCGNA
jgi:hypothetical protein